jgi:hypothetical protein
MRFIKTREQAAHLVGVLKEHATRPPEQRGKQKGKRGGPVVLANPNIIAPGPGKDIVTFDFRHHQQCTCANCQAQNAKPKRRKRRGSR